MARSSAERRSTGAQGEDWKLRPLPLLGGEDDGANSGKLQYVVFVLSSLLVPVKSLK